MEKNYWLALTMVKGLGPIRISKLLQHFKDAASIWRASKKELMASGIGSWAENIVKQREKIDLNQVLKKLNKKNIKFKVLNDKLYPQILKKIYDPPPVLFYKGNFNLEEPAVAIVGSRRSTKYGRETAKKIAYRLAQKGIIIVSGMARGIDTNAHLGALNANGKTVAIMGSGLDYIYPSENKDLFREIQKDGLVLSEFPPGVKPLSKNFPRRNRIISGLCLGTVVVEAASKSGSLITANQALEQGREVFAVPGNINRTQSKGTNNLIKSGAKIVTTIDDILEELFLDFNQSYNSKQKKDSRPHYPELTETEEKVVNVLQIEQQLHINEIIKQTDLSAGTVNTLLLKLELKGIVSREPGKKYSFKGLQNLLKPI